VRLHKAFTYRSHVCLVFEPLGCSLLDMVAGTGYRGLPLQQVRPMMIDLMDALGVLCNASVVHADLKLENVLMLPEPSGGVAPGQLHLKLIDFGSAVITTERGPNDAPSHYHQSRFYRAPEVLVGAADYSMQTWIDIWSCGCIAAELYLGLPIFPGADECELLLRIQEVVGNPPDDVMSVSRRVNTFFDGIVVKVRSGTFRLTLWVALPSKFSHFRSTAPDTSVDETADVAAKATVGVREARGRRAQVFCRA
jgi:dual specificity protein kinase YAK1